MSRSRTRLPTSAILLFSLATLSSASFSTSPSASSTASSSTPTASSTARPRSGVSPGLIAGAVLGGLVGIALILCGILLLLRRKKNKSRTAEVSGNVYGGNHQYGALPQSARELHSHRTAEMSTPPMEMGAHNSPREIPSRYVPGSGHYFE
ncbi:hypothetical protein P153DRAFT_361465 [Dothidotthia symphoricarpi CBS 119687]|uniref:Mid2 domain-containing protein n=1 Tax=Dothidotthia symphoricarpi CBS 119687 TaxID=1392245 RepID=A0A6A5ZX26_9PLEO|nr:uncharacterized protein P153DRAFT_361465 [Dothidotthia symphoricarpi CBS 119687]KAF2124312.1 hypothetical protein P153DRAFT_361465 [Dothidotthia symphoricarpi CBS 119687]